MSSPASPPNTVELDALIVGAGFGGVYQLKHLRDQGYNVKLVDFGGDFGGVWYWNRYPGARVDSDIPQYEFSDESLWKGWQWSQRFPGSAEIREYFAYVADKWDLRKDAEFGVFIAGATWDEETCKWTIVSKCGKQYRAQFFLLNTGFAAKRYTPDWEDIDKFSNWLHPSYWPHEEPDLRGKKIAVIGTGATGIQLAQELSKIASDLVLFQRTPNLCLPMAQVEYQGGEQARPKEQYSGLFDRRQVTYGGFFFDFLDRATFDDTPEQRRKTYQELWDKGDFHFWLATYNDMLFNADANKEAYDFWKAKVRARIRDLKLQEILAPDIQPHSFGCKRVSLENGFYEIFNQPNVSLVDVKTTPIVNVDETGINTTEKHWDLDYVVCATGFDSMTGGLTQIDIRGVSGQSLKDKWKSGVKTYLGMTVVGFPNMFITYGPQAPTAFCNGPTCAEYQGNFTIRTLNAMESNNFRRIEPKADAEEKWVEKIHDLADASLFPTAKSWYMGDNIPGKTRECLVYLGGVRTFLEALNEEADAGYPNFEKGQSL